MSHSTNRRLANCVTSLSYVHILRPLGMSRHCRLFDLDVCCTTIMWEKEVGCEMGNETDYLASSCISSIMLITLNIIRKVLPVVFYCSKYKQNKKQSFEAFFLHNLMWNFSVGHLSE